MFLMTGEQKETHLNYSRFLGLTYARRLQGGHPTYLGDTSGGKGA